MKKPNFEPDFATFGSNLGLKNFLRRFYHYTMLDIVACYQRIQFQGKRMIQT